MKAIAIASAAVLLAGLSTANAASTTGMIKSIDTAKDTITLDNGTTYVAPAKVKLSTFKVGEKVNVTYSSSNGKMEVSELTPAS